MPLPNCIDPWNSPAFVNIGEFLEFGTYTGAQAEKMRATRATKKKFFMVGLILLVNLKKYK
jgi:hypothetical protein